MAESDAQRIPLTDTVERLGQHFRDRDDVYVTGNHHDEPRERAGRHNGCSRRIGTCG